MTCIALSCPLIYLPGEAENGRTQTVKEKEPLYSHAGCTAIRVALQR